MRTNQRRWSLGVVGASIVVAALMATPRVGAFQTAPGYDRTTEVVVTGFVKEVSQDGTSENAHLHLLVNTATGTIDVDVAPRWFVTRQRFDVAKGDLIEVVGSWIVRDNEDETLVARRIKNGKHTITLRDKRGFPTWVDR
jgi:hypothetical protein